MSLSQIFIKTVMKLDMKYLPRRLDLYLILNYKFFLILKFEVVSLKYLIFQNPSVLVYYNPPILIQISKYSDTSTMLFFQNFEQSFYKVF